MTKSNLRVRKERKEEKEKKVTKVKKVLVRKAN